MALFLLFPDGKNEMPSISEVGGKAASLLRMAAHGLPVPGGAVLTTEFFDPWFDEIKATPHWATILNAQKEERASICEILKAHAHGLTFNSDQHGALKEAIAGLPDSTTGFAVRSSSPEEDMAAASFAGGYETCLGVQPSGMEEAIRTCFASSLDARVFAYKDAQGFELFSPRIAVVIQKQIDSDTAGVAFSLNPLTNDYDEAVIDANRGQGESVVAGLVTPDHFVVDKPARKVIESTLGSKDLTIRLSGEGGTVEEYVADIAGFCLTDAEALSITDKVIEIETLYGNPVDIEWAFADNELYVLQARPITTWVPLPDDMLTAPGERRTIYMDGALSDGMTMNAPISPLGLDVMGKFEDFIFEYFLGIEFGDEDDHEDAREEDSAGIIIRSGARLYMDMSQVFWIASPKSMAKSMEIVNEGMSHALASLDRKAWRSAEKPSYFKFWMFRWLPKVLWNMRTFIWLSIKASMNPERAYERYKRGVEEFETSIRNDFDMALPVNEFLDGWLERATPALMEVTMPPLVAFMYGAMLPIDRMYKKASDEDIALSEKLKMGFEGNVVVEMGMALHQLANALPPEEFEDIDALAAKIEHRDMPASFLTAWDAFTYKFGMRGPMEMDVASPRYGGDPRLALNQMRSMRSTGNASFDPVAAHQHNISERARAFEELQQKAGWRRRRRLRRINRVMDLLAGTRDTPKYHLVMVIALIAKRCILEGEKFVAAGRLDRTDQIFCMTFADIENANNDATLDLRALTAERMAFNRHLDNHVRQFPAAIDSRGRILRPPRRDEKPGELSGTPVSTGVVTGPVKLLQTPDEKPVNEGDILVAYTTDPGWTPLFTNAAGILLEVGGILQHGAVVAREYGKPCVAGVPDLMNRLHDGQIVEVDGTAGVVRLVQE